MSVLQQHARVERTQLDDPDAARELLCARYKPHDLRVLADEDCFGFTHVSAPVPVGTFNVLTYGARMEISPEPFDDFFMLEMPLSGGATIESVGRKSVQSSPDRALFLPPHAKFRSVWDAKTVQLMLQVRKETVQQRWQMLCEDPTLHLPKAFPEIRLDTPEGWRVRKLMLLLSEELKETVATGLDNLFESPLAAAAVDAALVYFRKHQATTIADPESVIPASLRQCVRYINDNLSSDLSVPLLLRQTNMSERSLYKLFKTFLHQSPRAYVEAKRLRHARQLLLEGRPVAASARASGFAHMGRFAATYEKAYGEKPSATRARTYP
jgi:AraC-like DNA-binding protein